jgi:hypothetical protein
MQLTESRTTAFTTTCGVCCDEFTVTIKMTNL